MAMNLLERVPIKSNHLSTVRCSPAGLELFWYFSDASAPESPGLHDLLTLDGIASGGGPHPRSEPRLHSAHPADQASRQGLAFPKEPTLEHPPGVKSWREVPRHRQRIRRG